MNRYKLLVTIITLIYTIFIFSYPASFYNDDSLFLARGISNFSVIDFSPHFPGYVSVVLLGKIVNLYFQNSIEALFFISAVCGILTPVVIYFYVKELTCEKSAFIAFLLTISSSYLLNISLSMLSDSIGLFFFFLGTYILQIKKYKIAGIVFSIAFFARPSYLILYLVGIVYIYVSKKESFKTILLYFFLCSIILFSYILIENGFLYFYEAERFIEGHFLVWGRGQIDSITWIEQIFVLNNSLYLLLFFTFFTIKKEFYLLYILFICYLFWLLFAQNPENVRHLLPLILIGNILLSAILKNYMRIVFLIFSINIILLISTIKLSPIDQLILDLKNLNEKNRIIVSNYNIEILRKNLSNKIMDHYYKNSAKFYINNRKTYIISTKKKNYKINKTYKGRFIGEKELHLIINDN